LYVMCKPLEIVGGAMSIEQIDEKLKCVRIQINDVANELYQSDPQRCSRLKVAGLNILCVRADIERAAELAQAKCLCDTCQNVGCRGVEIPFRGKWTMHECEGYSAPEPFGRGKV